MIRDSSDEAAFCWVSAASHFVPLVIQPGCVLVVLYGSDAYIQLPGYVRIGLESNFSQGRAAAHLWRKDVDVWIVARTLNLELKNRILEIVADTALDHDVPLGPLVWGADRLQQHEALQTLLLRNIQTEGVVLWTHP